jgi:hypothetical protein
VREGLNPGEELIAGDTAGLRSGQRVRVVGEAEEPGPPAGAAGNSKGGDHAAH